MEKGLLIVGNLTVILIKFFQVDDSELYTKLNILFAIIVYFILSVSIGNNISLVELIKFFDKLCLSGYMFSIPYFSI